MDDDHYNDHKLVDDGMSGSGNTKDRQLDSGNHFGWILEDQLPGGK